MSEGSISILITVGIIVLIFAWVLFLNTLCPARWRLAEKPSTEKNRGETRRQAASVSSLSSSSRLSSRRLEDQSRDFLHALSARGGRETPRSETGGLRAPPRSGG